MTKQDIKVELTLIFLKHMLKQHADEPMSIELSDRLLSAAAVHAEFNIKNKIFNGVK